MPTTVITPDALHRSMKTARLDQVESIETDEIYIFVFPSADPVNQVNGDGDLIEIYDWSKDFMSVGTSRGERRVSPSLDIWYVPLAKERFFDAWGQLPAGFTFCANGRNYIKVTDSDSRDMCCDIEAGMLRSPAEIFSFEKPLKVQMKSIRLDVAKEQPRV